jgi:hypothetical protein
MPEPPSENLRGDQEDLAPASCGCTADPFAALPADQRPAPPAKRGGLRKATCPGCGLEFWTNRAIDACFSCETSGSVK